MALVKKPKPAAIPPEFKAKLESSGLWKHWQDYEFECAAAPPWGGKVPALMGIVIPYHDMAGRKTGFVRYRYLVDTRSQLERLTDKKPLRYVQKSDTGVHIYLPRTVDWTALDKDTAIIITEGEFKAACAVEHGFAAVALGGVYSFKDGTDSILHKTLTDLEIEGRTIYIIFDSDAKYNTDVIRAENRLAEALSQHKAIPVVVRLPEVEKGVKCGLDDYLEAGQDLQTLLEESEPYSPYAALAKMNEKFCLVQNPLCVVDMDNRGIKMEPGKFAAYHYGHLKYSTTIITPKGDVRTVQARTAEAWLRWMGRRETVGIVYEPGEPMIINDCMNEWVGWGVKTDVVAKNMAPWHAYMEYIFKGSDSGHRKWFEQWLAYPIQHPGAKLHTACIFWGVEQGTGKSMMGEVMSEIYGTNAAKLDTEALENPRKEWAVNKQFAFGDEITGSDKRGVADHIKGLITQSSIRVDIKYVPSYSIADHINYYFTSNHPDAFYMDSGDRRLFVHEVVGPKESKEFYDAFVKWWKKEEGSAQLYTYLSNLSLDGFNPFGAAPVTIAKKQMIGMSRSDLGDWVAMLKEDPDSLLRLGSTVIPYGLWTAQEIVGFYDPNGDKRVTPNGMARELKRQGFRQAGYGRPCATADGIQKRLWIIRDSMNRCVTMGQLQVAEAYDGERMTKTSKAQHTKKGSK